MKSLESYIISERVETITDPDTGETVEVWRPNEEPEETAENVKKTSKSGDEAQAKYKKLRAEIWDLEDEKETLQNKIDGLRIDYRERYREMDEKVGKLYSSNNDAEAEKLANKYGKELENLSKTRDKFADELAKVSNALSKKKKEMDDFLDSL